MKTYKALVIETITREVWYEIDADNVNEARKLMECGESDAESEPRRLEVISRDVFGGVEECS